MAQAPASSEGGDESNNKPSLSHLDSSASAATHVDETAFIVHAKTVEIETSSTLGSIWQKLYYPNFGETSYDVLVFELAQQPAEILTERLLYGGPTGPGPVGILQCADH